MYMSEEFNRFGMNRKAIFLILAATWALAPGCSKTSIEPSPAPEGRTLVFSSEKPLLFSSSKTAWTGSALEWSEGDRIAVAYTCNDIWQNAAGTATSSEAAGSKTAELYKSDKLPQAAPKAQFNVSTRFTGTEAGTYQFYTLYPGVCAAADLKSAPLSSVVVPARQTPLAGSFDCAADLMIGKSAGTYSGIPSEKISVNWTRVVAHAEITFEALNGFTEGEVIRKIVLTGNTDAQMVGAYSLDLTTGAATKAESNTKANVVTLSGENLSASSSDGAYNVVAWASFLPCTLTSLDVEITTDKAVYTRSISGVSLEFRRNTRNALTVVMSSATRTEAAASTGATIRDFAEQYVRLIDVWENTTGLINMVTGEAKNSDSTFDVKNAHYIPSATTITVGGTEYSTADVFELAMRSYLLLRGYDGNNTAKSGAGNIPALAGGSMSTALPAVHSYVWGTNPYLETPSNSGHLLLGTKSSGKPCRVKINWLDNFAMRNVNFPMTRGKLISNTSSYVGRSDITGYYGGACPMRALITYAFFFEYLLNNNLEDATGIDAAQIFRSELFGDES